MLVWKIFEVEKEFQVQQQNDYTLLNEWLRGGQESFDDIPPPFDRLAVLQKRLIKHVHDWNEPELKLRFISPILDMIDFEQSSYQPSFEREIKDSKVSIPKHYLNIYRRSLRENLWLADYA